MSFDDLAFPNMGAGSGAPVVKHCPSCDEPRTVAPTDWMCPRCGDRMMQIPGGGAAGGGGPDAQGQAMLRQLMGSMAAAAAANGAAGGPGGANRADGDGGDGDGFGGADLSAAAAQLQSLFIPSLNSTYADMVAAQQGLNIDDLITRLLADSSLQTATPASKSFVESLRPRPLGPRDFLQLYLRFRNLPSFERDVFPTAATFGAAGGYLDQHARAQAEEKAKQAAAEAASAAAPSAGATATPPASESASASASDSAVASTPPAASVAPREHSSGSLVLASPLTLASPQRASSSFRGCFVLSLRGGVSFAVKARTAQDALARGLIVMQSEPDEKAWPYTMADSSNSSADIIIPCVMISQTDGAALQAAVANKKASASASASNPTTVALLTRERPLACCVCREDYELGAMVVELPCHHFFCEECVLPWLKERANCPLCRFALPTDAPKQSPDPPGPESNQAQLHSAMFT